MQWNVIFRDLKTGRLKPFNVFEDASFRLAVEQRSMIGFASSKNSTPKPIIISGRSANGSFYSLLGPLASTQRKLKESSVNTTPKESPVRLSPN